MRIRLRDERREFEGTARQIVRQMQDTATFAAGLSLDDYVTFCVDNARRLDLDVHVTGDTVDERCASLVDEMLRTGFAERV